MDKIRKDYINSIIGLNIRMQRTKKKMNQADLADATKMKRTTIVMIEKGAQGTSIHQIIDLADALHISPKKLIYNIFI